MSSGSPGPHGAASTEPTATTTSGNVRVDFFPQTTVVVTTLPNGKHVVTAVDATTGKTVADGAAQD